MNTGTLNDRLAGIHSSRGRYCGVLQVIRFNWPWYVTLLIVLVVASAVLPGIRIVSAIKGIISLGLGCGVFWALASILVSHWIYDLSPLTKWKWISTILKEPIYRAANIHCGFDESRGAVYDLWPGANIFDWDIYQSDLMSEGSIARARHNQNRAATPVPYAKLPESDNALDAIFLVFSAHEIRLADAREMFFRELFRILKPGASVLLIEHLRDWINFAAYGPGFFHFLGSKEWLRLAKRSGLVAAAQFKITPFILILKLSKPLTP